MSGPLRIYLSYDKSDAQTAADLQRQLKLIFQPRSVVFWSKDETPEEEYRVKAAEFLEKADLFLALLSMNYEDAPDVRWEMSKAIDLQDRRAALQIMNVQVREAPLPAPLKPFLTALPAGETIENRFNTRDRQLQRVAEQSVRMAAAAPDSNEMPEARIELPLDIEDVRERLLAQTDRINHAPLLTLLKRLIENVKTKRVVLDIEEKFRQLREQTRLAQISYEELADRSTPVQIDLQYLLRDLQEHMLVANWKQIFIRDYFHFVTSSRELSTVPPFFVPSEEIGIPQTLNLPAGKQGAASRDQVGALSFEQKNDFRRHLLLAKDALAVNNFATAYHHCNHVRTHIDPQSAQLYEYLLITFMQNESPVKILTDATAGNDRPLNYVLLYAGRYREYQRDGKCPSTTGPHNLSIAAEALSDAALRIYHHYPSDAVRHTGKHAEAVPDSRRELRIILASTLKVCRLVYPSEELLEAAVIESCGGGKYHWLKRVDVIKGHYQFMPDGHFDLLGEVNELLDLLQGMEANEPGKIVKQSGLLREDLYFSLLAKRQALFQQIREDRKRGRPFTDQRASAIRFVYACLLGAEVFGDADERGREHSFYRLALEYLLPELLVKSDPAANLPLRWFDLDEDGNVCAHPDCATYEFDVQAIVEKIVSDHAGRAGWLQVHPNIKESVYLQFVADIDAEYEEVKKGLAWTDFRRMRDEDARRRTIACIRKWMIAYHAYPERGRVYLDRCLRELTGEGLLIWFHHDPDRLMTHPDSLALGFDAQAALKKVHALVASVDVLDETSLRSSIAGNLFDKNIVPAYARIKTGAEQQRPDAVRLLREALSNFRLHPDERYLDFVFRELTEEIKFCWIDITEEGREKAFVQQNGFDPLAVLQQLHTLRPERFSLYQAREQIANRRYANQLERYFREISEYKRENRRPERALTIDILRKIKGIYKYFPKQEFLELPIRELSGKGRIRWHALLLGILPVGENHFENRFFGFDYKYERYDFKRLLDNNYEETQRVLKETGAL
ncbi:MAG: hypothetical protein R2791_06350 [Saprospiraceae bacterium]